LDLCNRKLPIVWVADCFLFSAGIEYGYQRVLY
jgi:hypothetical protein